MQVGVELVLEAPVGQDPETVASAVKLLLDSNPDLGLRVLDIDAYDLERETSHLLRASLKTKVK